MSSTASQLYELSNTQLRHLINERARFKQRSYDAHTMEHRPQLECLPSTGSSEIQSSQLSPQIDIILLGDSTIERFKTTGKYTQIGQLGYPRIFNAGVGGDTIENVLYRIDLGLLRLLKPRNPKLIVLQVGANNLQQWQALQQQDLSNYYLLLQALLMTLPPQTLILVTGLFKRRDVAEQYVDESNIALKDLVTRINKEIMKRQVQQNQCIHWLEPPDEIELKHIEDRVHLNASGYQMWNTTLYPYIQELLSTQNS